MSVIGHTTTERGRMPSLRERLLKVQPGYLFNPWIDFTCLGGGSLFVLLPIFYLPIESFTPAIAVTFLWLANVINHPHFAHSYQIFYRNFGSKAFGERYETGLRIRYIIAGIVVPLVLLSFFAIAVSSRDPRLMAYGFNIMAFLVGWHYVKQGYGMIVLDSVLKKNFLSVSDKRILLVNAYVCWIFDWILLNRVFSEQDYLGLSYYTFGFPAWLLIISGTAAAISTMAALLVINRKWRSHKHIPINGIIAYLVSIYVWLLASRFSFNAVIGVAAFHSLQYLVVVWRYQLNLERENAKHKTSLSSFSQNRSTPERRVLRFVLAGTALGALYFWIIPIGFDMVVPYDKAIFGSTMFLFMFWIFINVHHYFLDNVMWRRENPDVGKYLFASPQ